MGTALRLRVTPQEYLTFERDAETKHEYIAGEILAMAGGTLSHNMLATDVTTALAARLLAAGGECNVFNSDQRVRADVLGPFFYPDATVVCGDPVSDEEDCLLNPILIVEVLSESSQEYDRGEKFRRYRQFPSLRHYLLIAQDRRQVEYYRQVEGFVWEQIGDYTGADDAVPLAELGITLPLGEIYRRVRP